jgi:hypothetical protein
MTGGARCVFSDIQAYYAARAHLSTPLCCVFNFSKFVKVTGLQMPFVFARESGPSTLHPSHVVSAGSLFHAPDEVFLLPESSRIDDFIAPFPADHLEQDYPLAQKVRRALAVNLGGKKLSYVGITAAIAVTLQKFTFFTALPPEERVEVIEDYMDTMRMFIKLYLAPICSPRCTAVVNHIPEQGIFEME